MHGDRDHFRLLVAAAELGDLPATVDETVERAEAIVVPAFADHCVIDLGQDAPPPPAPAEDELAVPLRARGRTFGSMRLGRERGRGFDEAERELAHVLGGRVALALDNAGLLSEVEALEARMTVALGGLAEAVTMQDPTGRVVYANEAAARSLGFASPEELLATTPEQIAGRFRSCHPDGSPLRIEELPGRRVLAGLPADPLLLRVVDTRTGEERWRITKATAVHDAAGRPVLAVNVIEDVTEVKQAELAQRSLAETLQASLLPDALPAIPGFAIASLYRPASEDAFVGGDFYDAFPTADGWMLTVGDVTGRGAPAAALTGQARFTLRTAGSILGDPVAAVSELNRALVAQPALPLCTAAAVLLEDERATVVCAGHPPPLLVRDGEVRPIGETGPLLGAWDDSAWPTARLRLEPGDVVVLYTDGVIDAVGDGGRFGEERLAEALRDVTDADAAVRRIREELHAFERGPQADDTAILAFHRQPAMVPARV